MELKSVNLLTWYGAVLRQDGADEAPFHACLWPLREGAWDVQLEVPAEGLREGFVLEGASDQVLEPQGKPNVVGWRRLDLYRHIRGLHGRLRFMRRHVSRDETFLLIEPLQLALLRALIGYEWRLPDGTLLAGASVQLGAGFALELAGLKFDLSVAVLAQENDGLAIREGETEIFLRAAARRERHEIRMQRRLEDEQAPFVDSVEAFAQSSFARVYVQGERDFAHLPLVADAADRDWLHRNYWRGGKLLMGQYRARFPLVRERDKYVLTSRGQEGMVFDTAGVSNEAGYLTSSIFVPGEGIFSREGDTVYLDRAALEGAPYLEGCYVNICNGNLSNYYHWVIDGLLVLQILRPYLPKGTKLLIPQTLPEMRAQAKYTNLGTVDHLEALRAWGFDDFEIVLAPPPLVRVEEVLFHDFTSSEHFPADLVQAARRDILARHPPRQGGRKLYMRRRGQRRVLNAGDIEPIMAQHGFETVELEGMAPAEQIALFRDADIVVAPHGAGLSNLLFCAPGTKVLEITPKAEYRSCFVELSDKLGLLHAVLPADTEDNGFWTNMLVDAEKFARLLEMLLACVDEVRA